MLTWLDVLALFTAAVATVVGVRKGAVFLMVFPLAAALFFALADRVPPLWAPLLALIIGVVMAQLVGRVYIFTSNTWSALLGGIAGLVWGASLAVGLWTGLPAEYSVATGAYRYPSPHLPLSIQEAVVKSPFAQPLFDLVQREPHLRRIFVHTPSELGRFSLLR